MIFTDGNIKELPLLGVDSTANVALAPNYVRKFQIWVEELVQPHIAHGLKITTEVIAFRRLYEAVIRVAIYQEVMAIFKPMRHHSLLKRTLYTSTDWNLIRTCPFPLLLVNDANPLKGRNIIAALKFGDQDADHDELNDIIMSQALVIANLFGSRIQVVNAITPSSKPVEYPAGKSGDQPSIEGLKQDHITRAVKLAKGFDVPEDCVAVIEGQTEVVVDKLAKQLNAGVVILGSVARSGVAGLLVGNTAERVLEEISANVLVLKKASFTSPIQQHA